MKNILFGFIIICAGVLNAQQQLTLQQAMDYAVENSYEIQTANLDIEKAQKQIWESTAIGLPQVNAGVDYQYNIDVPVAFFNNQVVPLGAKQNLAADVQVTQLLFSGSYLVGLKSAKAFKQISELSKEKMQAEIKEIVVNAYASVLIAEENAQVLEKNKTVAQKNLNDVRAIYNEGLTEEQSVDQLQYSFKQVTASLNFAQRQKQAALNTLKYVLGIPQDEELELTTSLDELIDYQALLSTDASADVQQHIDYRIADHNVTINDLQVKYEKTFALPTLSTFFSHSQNNFSASGVLFDGFDNWNPISVWGLQLDIPVFSSFARRSRTQQAQIELEKAEVEKNRVTEQLTQQVKNAQLAYDNALENYETNQELVELSQRIYDKELIKYFEGISTSLDLSAAESQLYQSENQYIQSIFQVVEAKTALQQALGLF